ncbi:hypothetical protein ACQKKX_07235 [Neorhizobium sp. NPDC001467]|uniref:hypothetical protein n=1 Tax=Neorhizobium sp. NPDC001467 TaxID=3390595 RepID=UPI003D02037E
MTHIDLETSRRSFLARLTNGFRKSGPLRARDLFRLSSLALVLLGAALFALGAVCRSAATLPEWAGIAPFTAGMVILIFLTGRHS